MRDLWKRWVQQPQSLWLRKALFQVHLWLGLGIGLYIVMLSLTGSAIVYGPQLARAFETPAPPYDPSRTILSTEALTEAAERSYPGYTVTRISDQVNERRPVISVSLEKGEQVRNRLLNPYNGEDLGDAFPTGVRIVLWMTSLHDDLLFQQTGRLVNGVGSILATLLTFTGIILWWPGKKRWRRSLYINWKGHAARFNWDLHNTLGFWSLGLVLIWCISGIYLAFPEPFTALAEYLWPPNESFNSNPGDLALLWLVRLHFGRFRTVRWLGAVWVILGLIPAVMFITGAVMWWNRVVRKTRYN